MADTTFFYPSSAMTEVMRPKTKPAVRVSVIIPTFRRAEGLGRALASVTAQTWVAGYSVDIIVCDNSPEASARQQVIAFGLTSPITVTFVHEASPGVANARNSAVAACLSPSFSSIWAACKRESATCGRSGSRLPKVTTRM